MLCLNVSSACEYSVRFVATLCLDWPQLPPSPGFLWWDDLDVSSVLVITPEVPISKGGSPNFQAEGGNRGCGKICTVLCLYLPSDPTAEETCLASVQQCVGQLFLLPPLCYCSEWLFKRAG